jgi:hypothetical protein
MKEGAGCEEENKKNEQECGKSLNAVILASVLQCYPCLGEILRPSGRAGCKHEFSPRDTLQKEEKG